MEFLNKNIMKHYDVAIMFVIENEAALIIYFSLLA